MKQLRNLDWMLDRLGGNVNGQVVLRWCREGTFPCVRLGRRVLFDESQVEHFLEGGGTMKRTEHPLPQENAA